MTEEASAGSGQSGEARIRAQRLLTRGIGHTRFKQTEIGEIPAEWALAPLGQLVDDDRPISYGIVQTGPTIENGVPCVRVVDLVRRTFNKSQLITTTEKISASYKRTVLREGDIMFALRGEIGHVAKTGRNLEGANLTRGVALIAPGRRVRGDYLLWAIRSPLVRREILLRVNGSALKEIPLAELRRVRVLIPPKDEQKKIAEILGSVDEAIQATQAVIDQTRKVKQGLLQQLLTRGIGHTRFKQTEIGEIPEKWEVRPLEFALERIIDYRGKSPEKSEVGVPLITAKNVRKGFIDREPREYIPEEAYARWMVRGVPEPRDLIFTTEAPLGNVARAPNFRFALAQRTLALRAERNVTTDEYLFWYLQSPAMSRQLLTRATGSTALGVKQSVLRRVPIAVPDLAEQRAIAEVLETAHAEVLAGTRVLGHLSKTKNGLTQDLLTGQIRTIVQSN